MKRLAFFLAYLLIGTPAFVVHQAWWMWTKAKAPRKYEHWSYRLMNWADQLWWGVEDE